MSYRKNWLKHTFAYLSGNGLSDRLAKDFWAGNEDLWAAGEEIHHRGWKLFFAYSMSVLAQIAIPLTIVGIPIILINHGSWVWLAIAVGVGTALAWLGAVFATLEARVKISKEKKRTE